MQHAAPATQQAPAAAMADTDTVLRPMAPSALETMDFMKSPEMKKDGCKEGSGSGLWRAPDVALAADHAQHRHRTQAVAPGGCHLTR